MMKKIKETKGIYVLLFSAIIWIATIKIVSAQKNADTIPKPYVIADTVYIYNDHFNNPPRKDFKENRYWTKIISKYDRNFFLYQENWRLTDHFFFCGNLGEPLSMDEFKKLKFSKINDLKKPLKNIMWKYNPTYFNLSEYYPNVFVVHRQRDKKFYLYKITKWESNLAPIF
ncbi:hypothetical protein [Porphyromonas pogonae]|uniref:hypothetical protein n=1 Tax=Porphyromonas pogonae TaxID=867595 RepID=UPI002E7895D7|nr:hypothetical protein [Porphyromonas pogonae]